MTHNVTVISFTGHLTEHMLDSQLRNVPSEEGERLGLIVDVRTMSDYDKAARERFVHWNREHKQSLLGVAIITDKKSWRMVVSAMGMASGQKMAPFADERAARDWLATIIESQITTKTQPQSSITKRDA